MTDSKMESLCLIYFLFHKIFDIDNEIYFFLYLIPKIMDHNKKIKSKYVFLQQGMLKNNKRCILSFKPLLWMWFPIASVCFLLTPLLHLLCMHFLLIISTYFLLTSSVFIVHELLLHRWALFLLIFCTHYGTFFLFFFHIMM